MSQQRLLPKLKRFCLRILRQARSYCPKVVLNYVRACLTFLQSLRPEWTVPRLQMQVQRSRQRKNSYRKPKR